MTDPTTRQVGGDHVEVAGDDQADVAVDAGARALVAAARFPQAARPLARVAGEGAVLPVADLLRVEPPVPVTDAWPWKLSFDDSVSSLLRTLSTVTISFPTRFDGSWITSMVATPLTGGMYFAGLAGASSSHGNASSAFAAAGAGSGAGTARGLARLMAAAVTGNLGSPVDAHAAVGEQQRRRLADRRPVEAEPQPRPRETPQRCRLDQPLEVDRGAADVAERGAVLGAVDLAGLQGAGRHVGDRVGRDDVLGQLDGLEPGPSRVAEVRERTDALDSLGNTTAATVANTAAPISRCLARLRIASMLSGGRRVAAGSSAPLRNLKKAMKSFAWVGP